MKMMTRGVRSRRKGPGRCVCSIMRRLADEVALEVMSTNRSGRRHLYPTPETLSLCRSVPILQPRLHAGTQDRRSCRRPCLELKGTDPVFAVFARTTSRTLILTKRAIRS